MAQLYCDSAMTIGDNDNGSRLGMAFANSVLT
jgi:hypothetical protein